MMRGVAGFSTSRGLDWAETYKTAFLGWERKKVSKDNRHFKFA